MQTTAVLPGSFFGSGICTLVKMVLFPGGEFHAHVDQKMLS